MTDSQGPTLTATDLQAVIKRLNAAQEARRPKGLTDAEWVAVKAIAACGRARVHPLTYRALRDHIRTRLRQDPYPFAAIDLIVDPVVEPGYLLPIDSEASPIAIARLFG